MGDNRASWTFEHRTLQTENYRRLFLDDVPLLDVRAPVEFAKGAFPLAHNHPILDDEQRREIGKHYADYGQDAAIERGLELATDEIRQQRLQAWSTFLLENPGAHLYCFRGGLRSRTTQAWLAEIGVEIPLIKGGYKALRTYVLQEFEALSQQAPMLL
ncbi:MAG: tRNA 2-selenouridine(34) synthase MnmH, partial [Granulosicoccaceae bacterium]